ncbi:MAG: SOS response-associated peptidase [Rhodobacter sp.]|nr:SOS response-associated peptidase [Planctomycetales bacterium]MCC0072627.1 SOS response-associated peptidase [Rhodobacter sp.]
MTWQQYHDWLTGKAAPPPPDEPRRRRWNIPPTSLAPLVLNAGADRSLELARWGFVPHWWRKTLAEAPLVFNARSEEAASKPFFREAYRYGHCLIPAQGYYEWQGPKGAKRPFFITTERNEPGLCFAGLWSRVSLQDFSGITFAIMTRAAMEPIAHLHDRMPVILASTFYDDWLSGAPLVEAMQIDAAQLRSHEVGPAVGRVDAEGPELIEAFEG